jgi:4-hydroxy-3-polyprenylbenzoate decarboxylase
LEASLKRLIIGMTGATGSIIAVRLLQALQNSPVETHLIISKWARQTLLHETSYSAEDVMAMATHTYALGDMGAAVSSGSFVTEGMVIVPCSMRSLAVIAQGTGDHLVHRAADVIMKERRRLVLVPRETPLSTIHLENMLKLSRLGCSIVPPMPAFYNHPETIDDLVNHLVMRILDQFGLDTEGAERWTGKMKQKDKVIPIS